MVTANAEAEDVDLTTLLAAIDPREVAGPTDREITAVVADSREAGPGGLFVAIRGGQERDRHAFVTDAVDRGAEAVVVEEAGVDVGDATRIVVDDTRRALANLAARFHGHPARSLRCVGVTGTNGKSTTAILLRHVLAAAGGRCAYIGTLGFGAGPALEPLANTTPEAGQLQGLLARARDSGCRDLVMEVSSHGLHLGRVEGIDFDAAVFTNLSRDHLDFHGTEEEYLQAKLRLFRGLDAGAVAVVNADDPQAARVIESTAARVYTYGEAGQHVRLRSMEDIGGRTRIVVATEAGDLQLETALTGRYNCSNVVAAVAGGVALGIDAEAIGAGVAAVARVPGRFERIDEGQPFEVIVDYAHTPAGLDTVLRTARELTRQRLLCVFGCGGDRDTGKRPMMGRVAEELADLVYLTSDNPRSESPEQIIAQIAAGMRRADAARVHVDRRAAVAAALSMATAGDVVVLAGKGDENYQILADGTVPFDDRAEARRVLRS